jgi:hypothetical protein
MAGLVPAISIPGGTLGAISIGITGTRRFAAAR